MRIFVSMVMAAGLTGAAGAQVAPPSEVLDVHDHVAAVSADRIEDDITTLVSFGTRHTASETESETRGIGAARRWIHDEFERISAECGGCLEVMYVSETISGERRIPDPVDVVSVIAIQRGTTDPDRMVVMSGDIDSRASDVMNAEIDAPGANDNASGVAGVLEAARVLSQDEFAGSI
ncbi:MAG TPA: peptidase M28, partial [Oceanicaulis sp.]|nr:peptidase M28 [Oceanicaulis sp.]